MGKGRRAQSKPRVDIPSNGKKASSSSSSTSPVSPTTPLKTPADEGIEFFQSQVTPGESPLRVYELRLDVDGGPHKDRSVSTVAFQVSCTW
jgi:glycogen debranching enzyme